MTETLVAASAGKFNPKLPAPPAKTLKPDGINTICEPVVTFTFLAPTVAPAAMVIGTDKEVALEADTAPLLVMPTVPLTPCGMVNSTMLAEEKLVLLPVMVKVGLVLVAPPPGVILDMPGTAPLALPTLIVKFFVVLAMGLALSATFISTW